MTRLLLLTLLFTLRLTAAELPAEREEVLRIQIFLDQQNFSPGVIDGKMGSFSKKAAAAYNYKFGHEAEDLSHLKAQSLAAVPEIYATAIVPKLANRMVDPGFRYGDNRSYQASRRDMPYRSVAEFMAERYHTSVDFLKEINPPGAVTKAKHRSALIVPNVPPFRIEDLAAGRTHKQDPILSHRWAVVDTHSFQLRIYEPLELPSEEAEPIVTEDEALDVAIDFDPTKATESENIPTTPRAAIIVEQDPSPEQQLTPHDEHRALIVAAFPITPGKKKFIRYGTWKMINAIEFPTWRYDSSLLKTGKRSNKSLQIPSGPNNPVGVIWMGLSRKGIGIHGTNNPDKIGRGRSAGCIRLTNWDAAKIPTLIRPGATIIIK